MSPPETPNRDEASPHHRVKKALEAKAKGLGRVTTQAGKKWGRLKRPDYHKPREGVWCKVCGVGIGPGRSNHVDITIQFDDGSAHISPLCAECAKRLSLDDLEAIYAADMLDLSKDEESAGILLDWTVLADRKPIGFTR